MVDDFYLYILMRNDMDSLNPGKAVAQGAHAAHMFMNRMSNAYNSRHFEGEVYNPHQKEYRKWGRVLGYGTTITLEGNEAQIQEALSAAARDGYENDQVIDPTYPLKDGKVTHYFPCMTCAYIFAPKRYQGIKHLNLMK
jgi:hypothetical protein